MDSSVMEVFHFKRFDVANENSAMKVNTDGVLLGALATVPKVEAADFSVMDVGTGTGTIALMIAQRLECQNNVKIIGIDIDRASAAEAEMNFHNSAWRERLRALNVPLQRCSGNYDLILSNPPYYDNSLQNSDMRKNIARHTASPDDENEDNSPLSFRMLLDFAGEHLRQKGLLSVILPADIERDVLRYGRACGLFPVRIVRIRTTDRKPASRIVVEFSHARSEGVEELLTIHEGNGYSSEYQSLMKDFYLWA